VSDLSIHNVRPLGLGGEVVDIAVSAGRIAAIGRGLPPGARAFDGGGRLAVPGLCESHVHLDKAAITGRCTHTGGIAGAIAEVARLKADFTEDDVAERAARTLRTFVLRGTQRMRTHVEIDPTIGLRGFRGVRRAIDAYAFAAEVTVCVFPQDGLTNLPGTEELLAEALSLGAHSIGGAPYVDPDPHGQIDRIFALAREFDVDIDMHLDFGSDPERLDVEHVMRRTEEFGWGGRVAVGHATRFAQLSPERLDALGRRLADVGIAVTVLPSTDLYLMHRDHAATCDPPRGVTPLHRMAEAGVTCSLATNNVLNPFTPYGDGSALRMANLYANVAQLGTREALEACLSMVTDSAARLMNLADYGIARGGPADIVILDAPDAASAVATLAQPIYAFKSGVLTVSHPLPELHGPRGRCPAPPRGRRDGRLPPGPPDTASL